MSDNPEASAVFYMTLAIDIVDGHGLSNKARCELLSKKRKVMVLAVHITVKGIQPGVHYLTTVKAELEHLILKVGFPCR